MSFRTTRIVFRVASSLAVLAFASGCGPESDPCEPVNCSAETSEAGDSSDVSAMAAYCDQVPLPPACLPPFEEPEPPPCTTFNVRVTNSVMDGLPRTMSARAETWNTVTDFHGGIGRPYPLPPATSLTLLEFAHVYPPQHDALSVWYAFPSVACLTHGKVFQVQGEEHGRWDASTGTWFSTPLGSHQTHVYVDPNVPHGIYDCAVNVGFYDLGPAVLTRCVRR